MKINLDSNIEAKLIDMGEAKNMRKKVLIGDDDGSKKIAMRYFIVESGGYTPRHQHNYEHVVRVEKGQGIYIDHDGNEHEIREGCNLFVPSNELHQFKNSHDEPLEFICIILSEERKVCYS